MGGYWKFHRAMLDHAVWSLPGDQLKVWLTILSRVNYSEGDWDDGSNRMTVHPGSWVTSQDHLAESAHVGRQTVRTAIRNLIRLDSISTKIVTNRYTIITVTNWPIYNANTQDTNQLTNQQPTNSQPTANHDIRKERKEERNPVGFDVFWSQYFPRRRVAKQGALRAWKVLNPTVDLQTRILSALSKQSDRYSLVEDSKIPHAATWLNGRRWEDEIPSNGAGKAKAPDPYAGQSTAWRCVQCGGVHEAKAGEAKRCPNQATLDVPF